jgi:lipoprotein-releasing system ATP-binding protein
VSAAAAAAPDIAPVIAAENLTRVLPGTVPVTLVRDVTLQIRPGELVAVTGPSGSGKSSLLYLLGLLDAPTAGRVLLDGADMGGEDEAALAGHRLARIGFVFQFHFLLPEFTVLQNLLIPMRRRGVWGTAEMRRRAEGLLAGLDLADQGGKRIDQLSGGQRQRVAVARALANDPPLILADEPTGNLDSRNAANVFEIFRKLAAEEGRAVVAVTHDLDLAAQCFRRVHLVDGRVVSDGPASRA